MEENTDTKQQGGEQSELDTPICYAIIINDRHCDTEVEICYDKAKAIAHGRALAKKYCRYEDDYEEREPDDEWLFHATYSCEGDSITVVQPKVFPA